MREFVKLAGTHPAEVFVADRVAVINAGYYELKEEHLAQVKALNAELAKLPESTAGFNKIVLSGIYEDIPAIVEILDANKYAVVADDLAKESRAFSREVPETGCAIEALADGWCNLKEDPELFDPKKAHLAALVEKAKESGAPGRGASFSRSSATPKNSKLRLPRRRCAEAGIPVVDYRGRPVHRVVRTGSYAARNVQRTACVNCLIRSTRFCFDGPGRFFPSVSALSGRRPRNRRSLWAHRGDGAQGARTLPLLRRTS